MDGRSHGDYLTAASLVVLGGGAYGFVMASNYNTRPRPAEVVVDDGRWWVARAREVVDELYRSERMTP